MGFFGNLFGGKDTEHNGETAKIPWQPLVSPAQLETISEKSQEKIQVIYKHSTSCGISSMMLSRFTANFNVAPDQADLYFLDILGHRSISNAVAETFNVRHQSPQLLIISNGKVVFDTSHGDIAGVQLSNFI